MALLLFSNSAATAQSQQTSNWQGDLHWPILNREWSAVDGYTEIGWHASVYWQQALSEQMTLQAGAVLTQHYGAAALQGSQPLLRLLWQLDAQQQVIIGTLLPEHDLHPALYPIEQYWLQAVEQGLQYLWHSPALKADLWLNWRAQETQHQSEVFDLGYHLRWQPPQSNWQLFSQLLSRHQGGQLTQNPAQLRNHQLLLGAALGWPGPVHQLWVGAQGLLSYSNSHDQPSHRGQGIEGFIQWRYHSPTQQQWSATLAQFSGDHYRSIYGLAPYHLSDYSHLTLALDWPLSAKMNLHSQVSLEYFAQHWGSSQVLSLSWQW